MFLNPVNTDDDCWAFMLQRFMIFYGEYDTGSEQTLAACLNDASLTRTEPSGF
jgi:hypothetical protein